MQNLVSKAELLEAAEVLRAGGLVAIPTETVYGLGADAMNEAALGRVYELKGRPSSHPLIVHLGDAGQLDAWAREAPGVARELAARFWPGPLTLVLRKHPAVPGRVTGGQDTIALRMPAHPVALGLLQEFGGGIAAPSANRFGRISPTAAEHVREEFGEQCPLVLDGGPCTVGLESTILSLVDATPRVLRPGGVSAAELAEVLGAMPGLPGGTQPQPRVPGSLAAHYAPTTALSVLPGDRVWQAAAGRATAGERVAVLCLDAPPVDTPAGVRVMVLPSSPAGYARRFYAALRALDREDFAHIYVEAPPRDAAWAALWDRLERAAHGSGEG